MNAKPHTAGRLHHNAHVTTDMEAVRKFYEEIIGFPLVATWCEKTELFGKERTYMHCFFDIGGGECLAF
ncbi:MAG: VOC family protein, partial [Woeseiaceae bacterium]